MDRQVSSTFQNCQHSAALLQQLNEFRLSNHRFCDVILICGDTRISAHKNVLAAASPYFAAMFSEHFPECAKEEIQLQDIDAQCLQLVVDFLYTGSLHVSATHAQRLLMTAAYLHVEWAEECCAIYMTKMLDAVNCLGFKQFAEKQSNGILLNAASDFTIKHFQEVMRHEEFLDLAFEDLVAYLNNDEIYIHCEDALLAGLVRWVESQPTERLQHLSHIIGYLHPACVSVDVVNSLSVVRMDEGSSKWLDKVLDCVGSRDWNIFVLDKMGRKSELIRFDLSFGALTTLKPLPDKAFAVSLVSHRNFLYVQGGCTGRSRRTSFYYNIYRDHWNSLKPMLEPRSHHRSLVVDEFIYALGGNSKKRATNSVECLDLETNTAMYVESMLAQRSSMGAVTKDNSLYVMGGETDHRSLHSMERFDPREGTWQQLESLSVVNSYCTSAVIGNHIYCCEGLGSCMERYDLHANKWEIIDFCDKREFYEIFVVDNSLYSVSGEEISCYHVVANQWRTVFEFSTLREWDTAVGMQVMNYCA